jgi:hypothetical protein
MEFGNQSDNDAFGLWLSLLIVEFDVHDLTNLVKLFVYSFD